MSTLRSLLGVGRRALANRLDHLQATLQNLSERLRLVVADSIGKNIGSVVTETFAQALSPTDSKPNQFCEPDEPNAFIEEDSFGDSQLDDDPTDQMPSNDVAEEAMYQTGYRLPIALAVGLRTAAWWVRRCWTGWAIAGSITIGAVVGIVAFCNQPLAEAGLRLAESSDQITLLSKAAKAGAQAFLS